MMGIYKITNPKGKIYIGQSIDIEGRFYHYSKLFCKPQRKLYNSFKKYGIDKHKFEVITECLLEELNEFERYYQEIYSAIGVKGLNLILQETNTQRSTISEDTRQKLCDVQRKRWEEKGEEIRKQLDWTGKRHSEDTKRKISRKNKGKKRSLEAISIVAAKNTGKKRSMETKKKQSDAAKGVRKSLSHIYNIICSKGRLVLNTQTGIYYESPMLAAKTIGVHKTHLRRMLKGERVNKTHFIYA
jgi:group I intron endonuclease